MWRVSKMKRHIITLGCLFLLATSGLSGQGLDLNLQLQAVDVDYDNYIRELNGVYDTECLNVSQSISACWPDAGNCLFGYDLQNFVAGDFLTHIDVPLPYPEALAGFPYGPISLNVLLSPEGGFGIGAGSSYPTFGWDSTGCITVPSVPTIEDAGTYSFDPVTSGFGIVGSENFDDFSSDQSDINHGMLTFFGGDPTNPGAARLQWWATDGVGSNSGIDDDPASPTFGEFQRVLGTVELPIDITGSMVGFINQAFGMDLPVGDYPTAGGFLEDLTGDPSTTGSSAGPYYLFDPNGGDGVPFSGDELLQHTSYYMTYNDFAALGGAQINFLNGYMTTCAQDVACACAYAVEQVLPQFGCPTDIAAAAAVAVAPVIDACVATLDPADPEYLTDAVWCGIGALIAGAVAANQISEGAWIFPNDADHDYDGTNGRLLFYTEPVALPVTQDRIVNTVFSNNEFDFSAAHASGWNMVSVPINGGGDVDALFPDAIANTCFAYDNGYTQVNSVVSGNGYWIRFADAGSNAQNGMSTVSELETLSEGWNMIGSLATIGGISDPYGIVVANTLFGYDSGYYNAAYLAPGAGYWVRAAADGLIIIGVPPAEGGGRVSTFVNKLEGTSSLTFVNSNGISSSLHFDASIPADEKLSYSLPPVPPAGFDARFIDDMIYTEESGIIDVMNDAYPLTITYNVVDDSRWTMKDVTTGKTYHIAGSGSIVIESPSTRFELNRSDATVPNEFALDQNYPNPFNPTTNISFSIPEESFVTLTVWNLIGENVRTVHSGNLSEGRYTLNFNGRDNNGSALASGIYFYKIEAGNFTDSKKMLLLK